jgi:hypothetical protein
MTVDLSLLSAFADEHAQMVQTVQDPNTSTVEERRGAVASLLKHATKSLQMSQPAAVQSAAAAKWPPAPPLAPPAAAAAGCSPTEAAAAVIEEHVDYCSKWLAAERSLLGALRDVRQQGGQGPAYNKCELCAARVVARLRDYMGLHARYFLAHMEMSD